MKSNTNKTHYLLNLFLLVTISSITPELKALTTFDLSNINYVLITLVATNDLQPAETIIRRRPPVKTTVGLINAQSAVAAEIPKSTSPLTTIIIFQEEKALNPPT